MTFATADQKEGEWTYFFGRVSCQHFISYMQAWRRLRRRESQTSPTRREVAVLSFLHEGKTQTTAVFETIHFAKLIQGNTTTLLIARLSADKMVQEIIGKRET